MLLTPAIAFLFKSFVCSALMLGYYWLFLRNRRMHVYNRIYLLAATVLSILIPLLHFEWHAPSQQVPAAFKLLQVLPGNGTEQEVAQASSWLAYKDLIALGAYTLVSLFILGTLVARVAWVYRLKHKSITTKMQGFHFVYTQNSRAPFSFLNNLFWRGDIDIQSHAGRLILQHELAHIRQGHTWDKLFMQLTVALCWLNPCYWIIQKELSLVHEFLADENAITDNNTEAFAHMLLQTHYGNKFPDIIHPFFYSSTKRRLIMLNQLKHTGYLSMRKLMVLPVIAASVLLFSFKVNSEKVTRANKTIVLALDAGHGGADDGALGAKGLKEKDLTLKIANRILQLGAAYNVKVITIRSQDQDLNPEERVTRANNNAADMLVSVHVNSKDAESKFDGFDIMVEKRSSHYEQSKVLGSAIAAQLRTMQIQSRLLDKGIHVLRNADMPAVLIECGYMDNTADITRIDNDEQLDQLCRNILSGLVAYQNTITK